MFELPQAKRVRREDLNRSGDSDWSGRESDEIDAELQALLNAQIARSLGFDVDAAVGPPADRPAAGSKGPFAASEADAKGQPEGAGGHDGVDGDQDAADLGEFEFKLFSTSTAAPKVVLEDESAGQGDGDIVRKRPAQYYLVVDVPPERRKEYELAAVSGEDVLARSRQRSWGLEMPWKVIRIATTTCKAGSKGAGVGSSKPPRGTTAADDDDDEVEEARRRKRPGKKARIAQRIKERAKKQKQEAAKKQLVDKEEHLKDKKKRLNRLKKLRRRAKEKEKKQGGGGGGAEGGSGSDSDGGSE
ncbi:hypothetical protein JDV02_005235 [Purpureocillium takamizusanense]|uniref:Uncharacterized protein n=1 Tax=Purpureocillium takamizusanense TaxID=2060973 RepID=A0A9Q8QGY3_9HYPO|nr:uncharacterized protein JDV02_005235 [Purpureocillium takamizusanense]UNI19016.1 hypothetical protein JDV02_005235 [Purpureocillium takamizusanense]